MCQYAKHGVVGVGTQIGILKPYDPPLASRDMLSCSKNHRCTVDSAPLRGKISFGCYGSHAGLVCEVQELEDMEDETPSTEVEGILKEGEKQAEGMREHARVRDTNDDFLSPHPSRTVDGLDSYRRQISPIVA